MPCSSPAAGGRWWDVFPLYGIASHKVGGLALDHAALGTLLAVSSCLQLVYLAFGQAARCLATAHSYGVVHIDVKPENILLRCDPRESKEAVCLGDFGEARLLGPSQRDARALLIERSPSCCHRKAI